jgi:hypothetical protein
MKQVFVFGDILQSRRSGALPKQNENQRRNGGGHYDVNNSCHQLINEGQQRKAGGFISLHHALSRRFPLRSQPLLPSRQELNSLRS